ncbi:MAG: hypothetical protein QM537_06045 [Candidatus Symbiobacter sp.]|nr:hypothetical protein [Candidatus Symbiobacter sp.]
MAVVHKFDSQQKSPKTATAAAGGDGGPPMELLERVIKIEATLPSLASKSDVDLIRSDMAVMRSEMGHMATKVELEKLRADLAEMITGVHRELNMQTWRLIGVCGALVATTYFIATHFGH